MPGARIEQAISVFRGHFGREPIWIGEAPGRVNLIGEHTDYNDGFVLPAALDMSALVVAAPAASSMSRVWAEDLREEEQFDATRPNRQPSHSWSSYIQGVAWALAEAGYRIVQLDLAVQSSVPRGAGLSSSAALEVASAVAMAAAGGHSIPPLELARIAHRAETEFVGVPCGIMDQYISAMAVEDHALLIDCRTLESRPVLLGLDQQGVAILVVESGASRTLAGSAYRERRAQCEEAVVLLRDLLPHRVGSLRDVTPEELRSVADALPPLLFRRARHVVTENRRVLEFVDALRRRDLREVGRLMVESHHSLAEDYEVSSQELDLLVELAMAVPGVIGARLTGAGFGGCTVNLVREDGVEAFGRNVVEKYRRQTGLPCRYHDSPAAGGARLLQSRTTR